jgi:hypothetical protein
MTTALPFEVICYSSSVFDGQQNPFGLIFLKLIFFPLVVFLIRYPCLKVMAFSCRSRKELLGDTWFACRELSSKVFDGQQGLFTCREHLTPLLFSIGKGLPFRWFLLVIQ